MRFLWCVRYISGVLCFLASCAYGDPASCVYGNPASRAYGNPLNTGVAVADFHWASEVDKDKKEVKHEITPEEGKAYNIASGKPIFFWTRMTGDQHVLDWLKENKKLPIHHRWRSTLSGAYTADVTLNGERKSDRDINDEGSIEDDIQLGVGSKATFKKLQQEIKNKHFFDWRTWSNKRKLSSGVWTVSLYYHDCSPVLKKDGQAFYQKIIIGVLK